MSINPGRKICSELCLSACSQRPCRQGGDDPSIKGGVGGEAKGGVEDKAAESGGEGGDEGEGTGKQAETGRASHAAPFSYQPGSLLL
jgi:hypothetical protein